MHTAISHKAYIDGEHLCLRSSLLFINSLKIPIDTKCVSKNGLKI